MQGTTTEVAPPLPEEEGELGKTQPIMDKAEKHGVHSQGLRPAHLKTTKKKRRRYLAPMMMSKRIPKIM